MENNTIKKGKVASMFVVGRVLAGFFVCLLFLLIFNLFVPDDAKIVFVFMGIILMVAEFIEALASSLAVKLEITESRISGKKGIFHTVELDSPINQITQVKVEQTLFGKIFDYGNIIITTASATFDFHNIKDANGFRDSLNQQIEKCSK